MARKRMNVKDLPEEFLENQRLIFTSIKRIYGLNGRIKIKTRRFKNENGEIVKFIMIEIKVPIIGDISDIEERLRRRGEGNLEKGLVEIVESSYSDGIKFLKGTIKGDIDNLGEYCRKIINLFIYLMKGKNGRWR